MKYIFIYTSLVFFMLCGESNADSFEVTKVIEIGNDSNITSFAYLKWSPDGTKLSFYSKGSIYISDTLGTITDSISIDFYPGKMEWWSNNEFIFEHKEKVTRLKRFFSLSTLNIQTKNLSILEQYLDVPASIDATFEGPFKSLNGDTYYEKIENNIKHVEYMPAIKNNQHMLSSQENIIFVADNYKFMNISNNYKDTLVIIDTLPVKKDLFSLKVSPNRKYLILGNLFYNLIDLTDPTNLGDLAHAKIGNDNFICGIWPNVIFNPRYDEILVELYCSIEDGHQVFKENIQVLLYDNLTNSFTTLHSIFNAENTSITSYAPDGLKFSVCADGKAYIVYRKLTK